MTTKYRKLDQNIFQKTWRNKNGKTSSALYFKISVNGVTVSRNAYDPDNPGVAPRTLKEARVCRDKIKVMLAQGLPLVVPPQVSTALTFAEFVERVYIPYSEHNHRTHKTYLRLLKPLLPFFGHRRLDEISPFDIERFKAEQGKREKKGGGKLKGNTIRLYLSCLSTVFERAMAERMCPRNPCAHVSPPEITTRKKRRLGRDEEQALLQASQTRPHLSSAMIIMLECGPRMSEFFNLKLDDVTWDAPAEERAVRFVWYKQGRKRSAQPRVRWVPITERAWVELVKLKSAATSERLFPYDSVKKSWKSVCKEAGVEGLWFRWLRDEAASRWAEAGLNPFEIAALLGHEDVKTSMIYVKPSYARVRALMENAMPERSKIVAIKKRQA